MGSLPLSTLDDNPFNSRIVYDEKDIGHLAESMNKNGLLCPIVAREYSGRLQIVFGHRRVRAARLLGWKIIEGRLESYSDEEMLKLSLVENIHRNDITDYELALSFRRLNVEFQKTYEEIGELFGYSKSHVCNILAMLNLIDETAFPESVQLRPFLAKISEHHARILSRISDQKMRVRMLEMTVVQQLSVRELQRIVGTLRGWFKGNEGHCRDGQIGLRADTTHEGSDLASVSELLQAPFTLPRSGNFGKYLSMHEFDQLSVYDDFAPYVRLEDKRVLVEHMKVWFHSIAPNISMKVHNIQVKRFGNVALATAEVEYRGKKSKHRLSMISRGTVLFSLTSSGWKIVHKHWSRLDQNCPIDVFAPKSAAKSLPGQTSVQ